MALFRPKYPNPKTGERIQSKVWWFEFIYDGKRIRKSAKTTRKTVAKNRRPRGRTAHQDCFNA